MNLATLTSLVSAAFEELFSLGKSLHFDWHPSLEHSGAFYQSDICDRLSDSIKISPASIACKVKNKLDKCTRLSLENDNRGYLYVEASKFEVPIAISTPKSVLIYVQPPSSDKLSLAYIKFLSLIGLQLELLKAEGCNVALYIPGTSDNSVELNPIDGNQFFGKEGFKTLLELVRVAKHKPRLEDLLQFEKQVLLQQTDCSVVFCLTAEILSLPKVATILYSIRNSCSDRVQVCTRLSKLEASSLLIEEAEFIAAFEKFGLSLLTYIGGLEPNSELDFEVPGLENWLNLKWLSKSLETRLKMGFNDRNESQAGISPQGERLKFLLSNTSYIRQRAAFYGDSEGFLLILREILTGVHVLINNGNKPLLSKLNIPASFPQKISSIIEQF